MGKVIRQGLSTSVFLYAGLILGFVNTGLLFPRILPQDVLGFTHFIARTSGLLAVLSLLGLPLLTVRFFPAFRNKETNHYGYLTFILLVGFIGTLLVFSGLVLFQDFFIELFQNDEDPKAQLSNYLIREFYWGLLLWFVVNNFVVLLTAYATALQRPRMPAFLTEIVGRLITLSLLLAYFFKWIDQDAFVTVYTMKPLPVLLGLVVFLMVIGELQLGLQRRFFQRPEIPQMKKYGLYSAFTQLGTQLVNNIDTLMITGMLTLAETGIYSVFFLLSSVIFLSHKGMAGIASPMIAEYWQKKDMAAIKDLYTRMATNNLVVAVLVYIGILVNLDNAILFYGEAYEAGRWVAVFLGAAQVLNVMNGYNDYVLVYSPLYRYELLFKSVMIIITVVTNYVLIDAYGVAGAALATALTILLTNVLNQLFVYRSFKLHPFSKAMMKILLIGGAVLLAGLYLPEVPGHFAWDMIVRSALVVVLYAVAILLLRVSPDINTFVETIYQRIRQKI